MTRLKDFFLICASLAIACSAVYGDCLPSAPGGNDFDGVERYYCFSFKIAQAIARQEQTVPKVIYHFTKQKYADENAKLGTISPKVWDENIMGRNSRYALSPLRKGLYGTSSIETNPFSGLEYPALMEIQIKDECRTPERTASLSTLDERSPLYQLSQSKKNLHADS